MRMKVSAMSPSRSLLDFGTGLLIGLSITVALFAAMEEDSAQLRHNMLLAALAALGLAIAMIFAGRARSRRRRGAALAQRRAAAWRARNLARSKCAAAVRHVELHRSLHFWRLRRHHDGGEGRRERQRRRRELPRLG